MRCSSKTIPAAILVLMSGQLPTSAQTAAASVVQGESGFDSADGTGRSTFMCSVSILEEQPDYAYPVSHIEKMVREAEVVVRAVAVDSLPRLPDDPAEIRFRPTEVLRGPFPTTEFTLHGIVVEEDEFNRRAVPYRHVRPSGDGPCYTMEYRLGAEYLFLMVRRDGDLTPHWIPLGPTNEQIRGGDDPWVKWVREQL